MFAYGPLIKAYQLISTAFLSNSPINSFPDQLVLLYELM